MNPSLPNPYSYSIAVCTRNRASLLEHTLIILVEQIQSYPDTELLVIDNASSDTTLQIAQKFSLIRYIHEPEIGIALARNRAIRETQGKWLIYVDDDAFPIPTWFDAMRRCIEIYPDPLHCIVGKVDLEWEGNRPKWFPVRYETLLSRYDLGEQGKFLGQGGYILTTNTAFERQTIQEIGLFRVDLGHRDKKLLGGEDSNLFERLLQQDKNVWYEPTALVKHWVPKSRQTRQWLIKRSFWDGATQPIVEYDQTQSRRFYLRQMLRDGRRTLSILWHRKQQLQSLNGIFTLIVDLAQQVGRFSMHAKLALRR
jgi:glucosyl-dolichyl phosphate glucuronosyltransferase